MKKRLDVLLVDRQLAESLEKAQRLIRAGLVYTSGEKLEKPGPTYDEDIPLFIKGNDCPYVSRGGLKLAGALDAFKVEVKGRVAVDLGASTGGFTDCLLQRGVTKVYAIDVGRGQLHHNLQRDDRVISREKTHIDLLEPEQFAPIPTIAVADLSFISLRRAFPVLLRIMPTEADAMLLVKPQFEVKRDRVPKGGVVIDPAEHQRVVAELSSDASEMGLVVMGTCDSPIAGGDGNREFFLHLRMP